MTTGLKISVAVFGLGLLSACSQSDPILPGERLALRPGDTAAAAETENRALAANLPAAVSNGQWAQSPVSPFARTTHAALQLPLQQVWSTSIGDGDKRRKRLNTTPVSDGARIYTMSSDLRITATDTSGAAVWTHQLETPRDSAASVQGGGLGVADGVLYATSGLGQLTALEAATGSVVWTQDLDTVATGAPTISGGLVYLTSGDNIGWAIETDSGRVRWQTETVADINNVAGAPAPALEGDRVVFGFGNGQIQTTFRQGGLSLWSSEIAGQRKGRAVNTVGDITGDPVIADGSLYAGNHSGSMAGFDLFSGDRKWTLAEGALHQPWIAGGSVYFVSDLNELKRVDAETGEQIWSVALPGWVPSARPHKRRDRSYVNYGPILAGGQLIVASSDGAIRMFNPEDGALTSQVDIPGGATTSPIVVNGTLYVVSKKGTLFAYR